MDKRIIIAGGGTGGHIFPAIAVANALKAQNPSVEILFVGARGKMEMDKVPKAGYKIVGLDIAGFNRSSLLKNIWLPVKLLKSFLQVRNIFAGFKPDAAFGVGGYSSYPVLRYAQAKGIPSFLHESNAFAGKSNKMLAKKATKVFVASAGMEQFFPAHKILITGNPVRREIVQQTKDKAAAIMHFGLKPNVVTLLVVGGSLGARSINEAVREGLNKWVAAGYQLIWQTGKLFIDEAKNYTQGIEGIYVSEFITDMNSAYEAADLVISRAGAMSVTELCIIGKAVIFVPYPFAAEDHQTANAMALVKQEAAIIIKDAEAGEKLMPQALELAAQALKRNQLENNIKTLARADADLVIASEILTALK